MAEKEMVVVKEQVVKEQVVKEQVVKEQVVKEQVVKEQVVKEDVVKEAVVKEVVMKEVETWLSTDCPHLVPLKWHNDLWGPHGTGYQGTPVYLVKEEKFLKLAGGTCPNCNVPKDVDMPPVATKPEQLVKSATFHDVEESGRRKRSGVKCDAAWSTWTAVNHSHHPPNHPTHAVTVPMRKVVVTGHQGLGPKRVSNRFRPKAGANTAHKASGPKRRDVVCSPVSEEPCKRKGTQVVEKKVHLDLTYMGADPQVFKVCINTKKEMHYLKTKVSEMISMGKLSFLWHGTPIQDDDTAMALGMVEGDAIDIFDMQTGGGGDGEGEGDEDEDGDGDGDGDGDPDGDGDGDGDVQDDVTHDERGAW